MIFSGTEEMERYTSFKCEKKGIKSYGTVRASDGLTAYKAPVCDMNRLVSAGWEVVGNGSHYVYVRKGA